MDNDCIAGLLSPVRASHAAQPPVPQSNSITGIVPRTKLPQSRDALTAIVQVANGRACREVVKYYCNSDALTFSRRQKRRNITPRISAAEAREIKRGRSSSTPAACRAADNAVSVLRKLSSCSGARTAVTSRSAPLSRQNSLSAF